MIMQYLLLSSSNSKKLQFNFNLLVWSLIFCLICSVILLNNQVDCNDEEVSDNFESPGEDDDEIRSSEALDKSEKIQNNLRKIGENLVEKLGDSVKNALAPARNYYNLVNRYHVWFRDYKKLEKSSRGSMKSASEVLREEYAKVDKILFEEECSPSSDPKDISDSKMPPGSYADKLESVDFVYNVLRKVIDRLEESLAKLESEQGLKVKIPQNLGLKLLLSDYPIDKNDEELNTGVVVVEKETDRNGVDDEQVRLAMERVKRTVLTAATKVVANEAMIMANLALVSTAVNSMSSLAYLAPIVTLLGSANTPLTVWYLRNLELRAALTVINRVIPLSFLNCSLKKTEINNTNIYVDKK